MKIRFAGALVATVVASSALAADLPARKSPSLIAPASVATWGGFYAGGNVGYALTASSFEHLENGAATGESFSNSPNGVLGGAQIGARYQVQSNLYVGIEAAYSFRTADAQTRTDLNPLIPRYRMSKVGNLWSVSGNVGYAFGQYLAYAKAGYASTELQYQNTRIDTGAILGQSKSQVGGYVLGAGLEYAFTQNISLGLEYNYYNFNVGNQQQYDTAGAAVAAINAGNDLSSHVAAMKLNYRF